MTTPAARALVFAGCAWLLASAAPVPTGAAAGRQVVDPPASNPASSPASATLDRYCATCHNDRLRTGGLTLAGLDPSNPSGHTEIWERVVRKLRTREMPPPGMPRGRMKPPTSPPSRRWSARSMPPRPRTRSRAASPSTV